MSQRFFGGIHPHDHKEATAHLGITPPAQAPAQVVLSMSMHLGAPCKPIVAKGDVVKVGQKVGEIAGLGAPIHASVSGTVTAVEPRPYPGGTSIMSVVIENDFQDAFESPLTPHPDYKSLGTDAIVDIIREAGITGMGGAGFPTHVKVSSGLGKVDCIILNGAECEPYITADHRLMLEEGNRVVGGVRILMQAMGVSRAVFGVEENKPDAISALRTLCASESGMEVEGLHTRYPQGAEKQLIQAITGRQIPPGGLPAHVGCAVFNVSTAAAVYDAVVEGKPLTHRIVTVTGGAIKDPCNLRVPLGTSFAHMIELAGGFKEEPDRVLTGGPMMGIAQHTTDVCAIKGTNAVLCMTEAEVPPTAQNPCCIRCGRCVNVCPMHLTPIYLHQYAEKGLWREAESMYVLDCIECGSCSYICPARIPLVQSFRTAKTQLRQLAAREKAAKEGAAT